MRRFPSTTSVSLSTAWRRSCAWARAIALSALSPGLRVARGGHHHVEHVGVDAPVPGVERHDGRESVQRVRVAQRDACDRVLGVLVAEALGTRGNREARAEAFQIPFPGSGQRFVEIVHIEDQAPLRGPEPTEVHEVTVPAQLHGDARVRGAGEIRRHHRRRTAEEPERRLRHPAVADGQQVLDPGLALGLQAARQDQADLPRVPTRRALRAEPPRAATGPMLADRHARPHRYDHRRAASAAFSARASAATLCLADSGACFVDACFVLCAMAHLLPARITRRDHRITRPSRRRHPKWLMTARAARATIRS